VIFSKVIKKNGRFHLVEFKRPGDLYFLVEENKKIRKTIGFALHDGEKWLARAGNEKIPFANREKSLEWLWRKKDSIDD